MKTFLLRKKSEKHQDAAFEKKLSDLRIRKFTLKTGVKAGQAAQDPQTERTGTNCTSASAGPA
ncbi:MAG TPA: hypothetical protein VFS43_15520 [Polyangiaceae bacterium]|nr:hypothetical protein [Polyangiaceae bacterium]